ncbi:Alkaline phosphatase, partial [hydrothermal vent metagenome]
VLASENHTYYSIGMTTNKIRAIEEKRWDPKTDTLYSVYYVYRDTATNLGLGWHNMTHDGETDNNPFARHYFSRDQLGSLEYINGSFYIRPLLLKVDRQFSVDSMGSYTNNDVRVIYDADNTSEYQDKPINHWVADELGEKHRSYVATKKLTQDQFNLLLEKLDGKTWGFLDDDDSNLAVIDAEIPIPDDLRVAFVQSDENLGFTIFKHMNDDDSNGFAGIGSLVRQVENAVIDIFENFDVNSYVSLQISDLIKTAFNNENDFTISDDDLAVLIRTVKNKLIGYFNSQDEGYFSTGPEARNAEYIALARVTSELISSFNGNADILDKVTTFASLSGNTNGDDSTLVQLLNDKGEVYLAYAISKEATASDAPDDINYAASSWDTVAGRALDPEAWGTTDTPAIDVSPLGLDVTGLSAGVMKINGVEVYGVKDYSKAPITEGEILIYMSWIASKLAVEPEAIHEMGYGVLSGDYEYAARAARVYLSNNTPMEEFWANGELPVDISFDANAYLTANPDLVIKFDNDPNFDVEVTALLERLKKGALVEGDLADVIGLFQKAAAHYNYTGRAEGRLFGAYEIDLNGDGKKDIVRVTSEGLVTATISAESGVSDEPHVVDYVMQNGKFLGLRRDVDGDGIADSVAAPEADGGIWNVTLSSNGATGSGRTVEAAQSLALAGADMQPGADGIIVDVNGDGVVDQARVLGDGRGQITLGVADETAADGYVLSDKVYTGQTLQDAVASTNALQLLAWVAGNEDLILAFGANIEAAQVEFARVGSLDNSLNLGQFAMDNQPLLQANSNDMVAALKKHIEMQRAELSAERANAIDAEFLLVFSGQEYVKLSEAMALISRNPATTEYSSLILEPVARELYPDEIKAIINKFKLKADIFADAYQAEFYGHKKAKLAEEFNLGAVTEYFSEFNTALDKIQLEHARYEVILKSGTDSFAKAIERITMTTELYELKKSMEVIEGNDDKFYITQAIMQPHKNPNYSIKINATIDAYRIKRDEYTAAKDLLLEAGNKEGADALTAVFNRGPVKELYKVYAAELKLLQTKQAMQEDLAAKNGLDFTFDYNTLISERMEILVGGMVKAIAANDPTPAADLVLGDAVESEGLLKSLAKTRGFESGSNGDDIYAGEVNAKNKYVGLDGDDEIYGGNLRDELYGGDGDDNIRGSSGNDIIVGGAGGDVLNGDRGDDLVYGGVGDDRLLGFFGDDILVGGAGGDRLIGHVGNDILIGGTGDDYLTGGGGALDRYVFSSGDGQDTIYNFTSGDKVVVDIAGITDFASVLTGASQVGDDTVLDFGNGDGITLSNFLLGDLTAENFEFDMAAVDSAIQALIDFNQAPVVLNPVPDENIKAGEILYKNKLSSDFVHGDADVHIYNGSLDVQNKFAGSDAGHEITGGNLGDELFGGAGRDDIIGGAGNDIIHGGSNYDTIDGGSGADLIYGGPGNDYLSGGAGDGVDVLVGGFGSDNLAGVGAAKFVFSSGDGFDTIHGIRYYPDRSKFIIDVAGFDSFEDIAAVAIDEGLGTKIDFGNGDGLFLKFFWAADLTADMFEFGRAAVDSAIGALLPEDREYYSRTVPVNYVSDEDEVINFTLPAGSIADADGDALTVTAVLADGTALPSWLGFDGETQTFTGRPPQNFNGLIKVKVTASDGKLEASDVFVLKVGSVNDAPDAVEDSGFSVLAEASVTIPAADLLANDGDAEGETLTI